jgi:hypothetical protein
MSSMNKSCEQKQQQHIVKIFYMWMFCITIKGRNTKRFVQNWQSPSRLRQQTIMYISITKGLCTLITHIYTF